MSDLESKNQNIQETTPHQDEKFLSSVNPEGEELCLPTPSLEEAEQEISEEPVVEKKHNPHLDEFMQEMENLLQVDAKVKYALDFMESSLAQSGAPHFKAFWEVRNICLQLFKENLSPLVRTQLWTKYSELSKEARRLKEMLDEQSSFAAEQIEIAIVALENDIKLFEEQVTKIANPDLGPIPTRLSVKALFYQDTQKRLNLLNVQASRVNALRKELIKTDMRIRQKNKFFQRLSEIGDQVFPLRKELIKEVSQTFSDDVEAFIEDSFKGNFDDSLFALREEIKDLQGIAKVLTLNTHAFTHTRMRLSECWDKIKLAEKERKKERAQLKATFKQNFYLVQAKIHELKKQYESSGLSDDQAYKHLDEISKFMRNVELGRDEIKALRSEMFGVKDQILEKQKAHEQVRLQHEQEKERQRKAKIEEVKNEIEQLGNNARSLEAQELAAARDELAQKIQNSSFNKFEKQEVERLYKSLRSLITDVLSDKEEQALLSLSEDDRQSIEQLREVLKQRKERRQAIKVQLESLRKAGGVSGLDFEKAMNNNELIKSEKERLEKINQGIQEIENKIVQFQKKK
ncbi:hypothetical protein [Neochlamydia sp. S13]|uniref:hypothetical protein n=1 Tax=Neochlamydia sp. S13 TaxID=1353976 RepID=UPI0005A9276C|nr:hypothetical protein [Neochlamydia sp. S13]BBI17264.1 Putative uncharacterized protein [Neochlamydia sp. S13]BBI18365.1 Putative uncharacterized protein [Neochlamydia sp. S13]